MEPNVECYGGGYYYERFAFISDFPTVCGFLLHSILLYSIEN